ncbi:MAG: hypothetical protein HOW73_43215 [Polyangiaceae bacterium]|nr:hypothetical protein [Polyangiaceae bacterium]
MSSTAITYWASGCVREMPPGQVKRVPQRGGLVGYFIACPGCRFIASYLDDHHGFLEECVLPGHTTPVKLVGIEKPPRCFRCRKSITVVGASLEVPDA